ncbi:MAG: mechanosensitive ion channel family protein, partial [Candidatus Binatia bacterium]
MTGCQPILSRRNRCNLLSTMLNTDALPSLLNERLNLIITWLLTSGVRVVLLLVALFVLLRVIRLLTERFAQVLQRLTPQSLEGRKRVQTLSSTVRAVATTVLLMVMTMLILGELGINVGPLIAAAGIGGLAIGFGAQNLVRDVITGFFIILEDRIRVGDTV